MSQTAVALAMRGLDMDYSFARGAARKGRAPDAPQRQFRGG